jgi:hypothetical protein
MFLCSMSCSYIRGLGKDSTSVLVDYGSPQRPDFNTTGCGIQMLGTSDVIIADMAVDRTNSSFRVVADLCVTAKLYKQNLQPDQNATLILATPECIAFWQRDVTYSLSIIGMIHASPANRIHITRIRTLGGVSFLKGSNSSISSSDIYNYGGAATLVGGPTAGGGIANSFYSWHHVYNNTLSNPTATCVWISLNNVTARHNRILGCGASAFVLAQCVGSTLEVCLMPIFLLLLFQY